MKKSLLSPQDVLSGYAALNTCYPFVPPLLMWRAWEFAAFQRYKLAEPVLDLGCGDGRFFRLVWPQIQEVLGVDMDPNVVAAARASGVYRQVYLTPAHELPVPNGSVRSVFANCSLEHMDSLAEVLAAACRCLAPGGAFLCSVVTDKFLEWSTLPKLLEVVGEPARARSLQSEYEVFHHLRNPFTPEVWSAHLRSAGLEVVEHIPIVPELTSRFFLFLDHLWHVAQSTGELGDVLGPYFDRLPNARQAFQSMLNGMLQADKDWEIGSGAVFYARKVG